jgi:hypothetical protein
VDHTCAELRQQHASLFEDVFTQLTRRVDRLAAIAHTPWGKTSKIGGNLFGPQRQLVGRTPP